MNWITYLTFQEVCKAHGLLETDQECDDALVQASHCASGEQLGQLFVTIVMFCQLANLVDLFENNWKLFTKDIEYRWKHAYENLQYNIPKNDIINYILVALKDILNNNCSSSSKFNLPMPNQQNVHIRQNRLIHEEMNYNLLDLQQIHMNLLLNLNLEQMQIYQCIKQSIDNNEGQMIFVYRHGGTSKTYLWNTIISGIRPIGKIVLTVASSGIASFIITNR